MKAAIHPAYYPKATVTCACGHVFTVGSTVEDIRIELCSTCHPFYTGKQNFVDTSGRIEKFAAKTEASAARAGEAQGKKAKAVKRAEQKAAKKAVKPTLETLVEA
jgi:large subunit ribosomal protein L31